jgi:FdhE protein
MTASAWDRRIERAGELAKTCPAAAELLRFYREILQLQKILYQQLASMPKESGPPNLSVLLPHFAPLLSLVQRVGPAPLAKMAGELAEDRAQWEDLLVNQLNAGEGTQFFARTLLQPYFEYLAGQSDIALSTVQPACPFCGEKPQAAILRGEGDGGKRFLLCSLCSTEWDSRRILCPSCGEERERQLPVYTAKEFPHVRIEACDTCRTYIKSVDLTKNGLAVPVVDELATISLALWADERGYTKVQLNLLGM